MAKKQSRRKSTRGAARKSARGRTSGAGRQAGRKTVARKTAAKKTTARKKTVGASAGKRVGGAPKRTASRKRTTGARGASRGGARSRGRAAAGGGQLSRSTSSVKWIESPEGRAERPGQTLATRSHEVIQRWAEERGAQPATTPSGDTASPRVLRFDFPGFGGQSLEPVGWDEWFRTFDERNLVFVFQDQLKNGNQSNFFRLDNPEREDA